MQTTEKQKNSRTKVRKKAKEVSLAEFKPTDLKIDLAHIVPSRSIKGKVGRPFFDGEDEQAVVAKLTFAFCIGVAVQEACILAGISSDSFYRYLKKNPEFRNRIELFQLVPILKARSTIFENLKNPKVAMWFLERKVPEEFGRDPDPVHCSRRHVDEQHELSEEEREQIEEVFRKNLAPSLCGNCKKEITTEDLY